MKINKNNSNNLLSKNAKNSTISIVSKSVKEKNIMDSKKTGSDFVDNFIVSIPSWLSVQMIMKDVIDTRTFEENKKINK